jgi:hypothetical protein
MVASRLKVLEGGRRASSTSSRVTPGSVVRFVVERSQGRAPSLKDVLADDSSPRRA